MDLLHVAGARKTARIRLAVMDMWKPFRLATTRHAPQAKSSSTSSTSCAISTTRSTTFASKSTLVCPGGAPVHQGPEVQLAVPPREPAPQRPPGAQDPASRQQAAAHRLLAQGILRPTLGLSPRGLGPPLLRAVGAALKWQRLDPYEKFAASLSITGRGSSPMPPGEQGRARLRRRAQQQDPHPPAPRLRASRRRVPPPQDPHLHAAGALTVPPYP